MCVCRTLLRAAEGSIATAYSFEVRPIQRPVLHGLRDVRGVDLFASREIRDRACDEEPLATRMAVEAAMAFIDLIRSNGLSRLRICAFPGCNNVVIDLSKNGSKRFCESGCGNRAAVAAYRARKAGKRV